MNAAGAIIARLTIPHQPDGFRKLETTRQQLAVTADECLVGLETGHNLLLDHLWDHGYEHIYVIPLGVVKSSRGRYGHSEHETIRSMPSFWLTCCAQTVPGSLRGDQTATRLVNVVSWQSD
jgi:hypothetical protein